MTRVCCAASVLALSVPSTAEAQIPPSPPGQPAGELCVESSFAPAWGFLAYDNDSFALTPSDFGQCLSMTRLGLVVCGVKSGQVLAFEALGGKLAWEFATRGAVRGKPLLTADGLFVASSDGCLYRLDPTTGKATWDKPFCADAGFYSDVAAWGGLVFASSTIDKLYAIEATSGTFRWEAHRERPRLLSSEGVASPVVHGNRVLAGFSDGMLLALDAATGNTVWEFDLSRDIRGASDVDSTPVVVDGIVYTSAFGEGPAAIRMSSGELVWRASEFGASRPIVSGDSLITGTADGMVVAMRLSDGAVRWRTRLATTAAASPVLVAGAVVVGGDRGLWLLRQSNGAPMVRLALKHGVRGTPEVAGRRLFFVGGGGTVNAVDILAP